MTREEAIRYLSVYSSTNGSGLCTDKQHYEAKQVAIRILEQDPCGDCISRKAVLDEIFGSRKNFNNEFNQGFFADKIRALPPVTPQPKMGCENCIYEKTGNNSTYPCSHCSRCYTDKYKAESEG